MLSLNFFNSRTGKVERFEHNPATPIHIYTCGPTVYDEVHIGNLKTFLWSDFIVIYLRTIGYATHHIMNITDIDDKIIQRLPIKTKDSLLEYTAHYTNVFLDGIHRLGVRMYDTSNIHKITENVDHIFKNIAELHAAGNAYVTQDGSVYFNTSTYTGKNPFACTHAEDTTSETYSGRTIRRAEDVLSPRDFALWKAKPDEPLALQWELKGVEGAAPGRMGWHIECSALAEKVLGTVHIKMGGSDLKHIHHAAEIYQSETLHPDTVYGTSWIHFGFVNFSGEKMSKSLGNVLRLRDLEGRINLKLLRLYLLSKSYRNDFDFNESEIEDGSYLKKQFVNFHLLYNKLSRQFYRPPPATSSVSEFEPLYEQLLAIIANDFDTGRALNRLFEYINKWQTQPMTPVLATLVLSELEKANHLFNILDNDLLHIDAHTLSVLEYREQLRLSRQFEESDRIRKTIQTEFIFEDDKTGYTLIRKV